MAVKVAAWIELFLYLLSMDGEFSLDCLGCFRYSGVFFGSLN